MERKEKVFLTSALVLVVLGAVFVFGNLSLGKLRMVACDVGQGDATLIISPSGKQVLVDGGPGTRVLDCLGQKMPFWDRTIELVVLTHPQRDHMEGLLEVLSRYEIGTIVAGDLVSDTDLYKSWEQAVKNSGAKVYLAKAGDKIYADKVNLEVLWPQRGNDILGVSTQNADVNEDSLAVRVNFGSFCAYLTGDLPKKFLEELVDRPCQVLKVSHHGSKTGTSEKVVDLAKPQVALIEVGKNNYGHPNQEVLDIFSQKGVKVLRTDKEGNIEIDSDGGGFVVKN